MSFLQGLQDGLTLVDQSSFNVLCALSYLREYFAVGGTQVMPQ